MILITKKEFNNDENYIHKARSIEFLGYCSDQTAVLEYLKDKEEGTYKGWDGERYPQYDIQFISKL